MFRWHLFLGVLLLAAFSQAQGREVYQNPRWRELVAATTPAPVPASVEPIPANPCFQWGCPSKNTNCASTNKGTQGTTGPAGAAATGCIVDYRQITINLNSNQALTPAATALKAATTQAQITTTLFNLAPSIGNAFGVQFVSQKVTGKVMAINADITCNNCGQAALATAANTFMNAVPPYMFAAMNLQLVDVWTCMTNDTTTDGVCLDNVNAVVGNPPPPTPSSGGAGPSAGIIIGAVAGGVVGILAIAGGVYVYKKRQAQFTTTSRNISSSNATAHTVSGPMSNPGVGMGMNNNFNHGAQMQQMQRPNQYMPNNGMAMQQNPSPRSMPVNGGYGQNQNWNNNRGWN